MRMLDMTERYRRERERVSGMPSGPDDFYLISSQLVVNGLNYADGATIAVDPTKVNVGGLRHTVGNNDPRSLGDPIGVWRTCTTVYDKTHSHGVSPGYDTEQADGGNGGGLSKVNVGKITTPTTFRIKLWANQNDGAPPPPASSW